MQQLKQLDDKILHFKQLKEQAETRLARTLFKKLQLIFGKDLDLNLITLILDDVWIKGNLEQKETWLGQAATFSRTKVSKAV